jgi:hypothetical protein
MTAVAEYKARRGFKWLGVSYERGDRISRATFLADTQVGESRLGSMQRTGIIEPVNRPVDKMTKNELVAYGREVGADVHPNMNKADLAAAIEGVL